jgi:hypothetical protein
MSKRKERMSAKRHILKGQISICKEDTIEKIEAADEATRKCKRKAETDNSGGTQRK